MRSLTEGRRREGKNKRGRLEKECAEGVRAAAMSHLSALRESVVSDIASPIIQKGGGRGERKVQPHCSKLHV